MGNLTNQKRRRTRLARGFKSPVAGLTAFALLMGQIAPARATIDNTAQANGFYLGAPVLSNTDSQSVPVVPAIFNLEVVKSGVLNDDDGTPGLSAGDTIAYTATLTNTGNRSLSNITVSDPLVALTLQSGDADGDLLLDVDEVWTYSGSYTLTQNDLDTAGGGDNDIDNTVTVDSDETGPVTDSNEVAIEPQPNYTVVKNGILNDDDGTAGISAGDTIDYEILVDNTGSVSLTNITLSDVLEQNGTFTNLTPVLDSGDLDGDSILDVGETWRYTVSYTLTPQNVADGGDMENRAIVFTDEVGPRVGDNVIVLGPPVSGFTMEKIATLSDADSDGLGDFNETITYTFRFRNTGNTALTNLAVSDPLPGLSPIACSGDFDNDGDIDTLAAGLTAECTATYVITADDVNTGSVDNVASPSATAQNGIDPVIEDDASNDNATSTPTDANIGLVVEKSVSSAVEILPNIVELDYEIIVRNTQASVKTNVTLEDDILAVVSAPAEMIGDASIVSFTGFNGGTANPTFDGRGDNNVFVTPPDLAGNATGTVVIRVIVDRRAQDLATSNVAIVTATELPGPVPSDDPNVTPGDPNDRNPTVFVRTDSDNDGSPDNDEPSSNDRDGDGVGDAADYDPTGYFYCETDGRLLTGGLIAVENVATGGVQTGVGSSNDIVILRDGSNGFYQFYVRQPGAYRLLTTLPSGTTASTTRLTGGQLDATSLLPFNPGVIGSGEFGNTGVLADFDTASNPFFTEFVFENGDPTLFNNNIPIGLCGAPELEVAKELRRSPVLNDDGSSTVSYTITLSNVGTEEAQDVTLIDDLDDVFGNGTYDVEQLTLENAPASFSTTINAAYDGSRTVSMLSSGGLLQPDENIIVRLDVTTNAGEGDYTNTVLADGVRPDNGDPIGEVSASVAVSLQAARAVDGVIATKSTPFQSAPLGAIIPYRLTFENTNSAPVVDAELMDFMPPGFTYVPNTARIAGVSTEPKSVGARELVFDDIDIAPGETLVLDLSLALGAAAGGEEFINTTWLRDGRSGELISNKAKARIYLEIESVFQCSHIIGRVFDDLDADGYYDEGEPGLAGVRVVSVNGLIITTDQFGRYHVTCDAIPRNRIGSNYILKLDERTLPTGYSVTSENPRVVRVTRGKLVKMNFAAANLRVVDIELTAASFKSESTKLTRDAIRDIATILPLLERERSQLRINYSDSDTIELKRSRVRAVRKLVDRAWKARSRPYVLDVITENRR